MQTPPHTKCTLQKGCYYGYADCGTLVNPGDTRCDGPNDCADGQVCCHRDIPGGNPTECFAGTECPSGGWHVVCDPLNPSCSDCERRNYPSLGIYTCP